MKRVNVLKLATLLLCISFSFTLKAQSESSAAVVKGTVNLDDKYEAYFEMLDSSQKDLSNKVSIDKSGQFLSEFNIDKPQYVQVVMYPKARDRQLAIFFPLYIKPGTVTSLDLSYDDKNLLKLNGGELSSENSALIQYSIYRNNKTRDMFFNPPAEAERESVLKSYIEYPAQLIADLNVTEETVKQFIDVWSLNAYLDNARSLEHGMNRGRNISLDKYFDGLDKSPKEVYNYPEVLFHSDSFRNMNDYIKYINTVDESDMSGPERMENRFKLFSELFTDKQMQQTFFERELEGYLVSYKIDENTDFENALAEFTDLTSYVSDVEVKENLKTSFAKRVYSIPGSPMPSVKFLDIDGNEVALESFKGNYVYIDLWASWCGPCIKEIPNFKKLEEDYKDKNIVFLSLSVDANSDDWRNKVKELQLGGNQLELGESEFDKIMNVTGIPHFILYDDQGNLKLYKAPRPSTTQIRELFDAI